MKSTPTFARNDRVEHSVYGAGTIEEVNERHTTIAFDEAGTRKFMTSMVKLEPSNTPPPAKPSRKKKTKS